MTFCIFPVDCPRCALLSSTKFSSKRCDICRVFSAWSVSLLRISVKSLSNNVITEFLSVRFFKKVHRNFKGCHKTAKNAKCVFSWYPAMLLPDPFHSVIANWWRSEVKLAEIHISSFCPANYSFHLSIQFCQFLIAWLLSVLQHVLSGKVLRMTKTNF